MFLRSYQFNSYFKVSKMMTQIKLVSTVILQFYIFFVYVDIKFCAVLLVSYCSTQF